MYLSDLGLKVAAAGMFELPFKGMGKPSTLSAQPAATCPQTPIFIPPQGAVTIGGTANNRVVSLDLQTKRPVDPVKVLGSTVPVAEIQGEIGVTGKATFWVQDDTDMLNYLNNTQPAASFVWTGPASTLTLQRSKLAFENVVEIDRSKHYQLLSAQIRGLYNATDGGSLKAVEVSSRATTY